MLGVPYEDHGFFQEHANVGLARYAKPEDSMKGAMSLAKYLSNLVETKMENPAEDAVSDIAERVTAGEISVKEAAQLASGLLIAGHETTANMIGIGVLALLENPEQLAFLRDTDDPKAVANAVEELLRYLSIIQNGQRRVATALEHHDVRGVARQDRGGQPGVAIEGEQRRDSGLRIAGQANEQRPPKPAGRERLARQDRADHPPLGVIHRQ